MEWIICLLLLAVFLWRRYFKIFSRRVWIVAVDFHEDDRIAFCSFIWRGRIYTNGYFECSQRSSINKKRFAVKGYDIEDEVWQLEIIK